MSSTGSFRDLIVWQKAISLTKSIYQLTAELPRDERFGLVQQMRRAAVSVPSNIAEGHGRRTTGEQAQFLSVAMGSLRELQTQIILCRELGFVENVETWEAECEGVARLLYRFQQSLTGKPRTEN